MKKKLVDIILVGTLLTSLLTGCAGGGQQSEVQPQDEDAQKQETQETGGEAEDTTTYRIAILRPNEGPLDFLHTGVLKELEEKHNVNIEWDVYYSSDWSEQKSLLLAGGNLPDAFFGSNCEMVDEVAKNQEMFVELTDLVPEYMPNLARIMQEDKEMLALAKDRDGKIYGLPSKEPFVPVSECAFFINQKWLDNLGLEVPKNYQELEAVMRAFKEQDADGDGDPDNEVVATGAGYAGMDLYMDTRMTLCPFGIPMCRLMNYMGLEDGTPVFVPAEEKYKEAVIWMHNLYKDGVLDPEWFTANHAMNVAKNAGCVWDWNAPGEDYVTVEAIEGPDGNRYVDSDPSTSMHQGAFFMTKSCENPGKLLEWVDDFYTDEVSLQTYFGSIPDCVKDNGDGTYDVLEPENGNLDGSAWDNSFKGQGISYMSNEFESKVNIPDSTNVAEKLAGNSTNEKYVRYSFPCVKYTVEESEALAGIQQALVSYAEMQYAHWVVDGGIEEEWDAYLKQLDDMQLQKYIEIQTQAYQAYLNSME